MTGHVSRALLNFIGQPGQGSGIIYIIPHGQEFNL
jgi:hypothetical protein